MSRDLYTCVHLYTGVHPCVQVTRRCAIRDCSTRACDLDSSTTCASTRPTTASVRTFTRASVLDQSGSVRQNSQIIHYCRRPTASVRTFTRVSVLDQSEAVRQNSPLSTTVDDQLPVFAPVSSTDLRLRHQPGDSV